MVTPPAEFCPACGSADSQTLFRARDRLYRTTDAAFRVVECRACRLARLSPRPSPAELRRYYPDNYWYVPELDTTSRLEEWYRRLVLRDHVRFVQKALDSCGVAGPLLDVGCGGGLFLRMMQERKRRVVGLDFSLGAAAVAWEHNRAPAVCGTLSQAPFPAESWAAITMFHVLEHLYDPGSYLDSAHRLLHPEGRLIVQAPNAASWQFLLLAENWTGVDVPRHLWTFRARDLEILLDRCGFQVLRVKHFSLRDNPACLATSLAPGLDPMARRVRGVSETPGRRLLKDMLYLAMAICCVPFTLLEAACGAGCTVMIEARKKP